MHIGPKDNITINISVPTHVTLVRLKDSKWNEQLSVEEEEKEEGRLRSGVDGERGGTRKRKEKGEGRRGVGRERGRKKGGGGGREGKGREEEAVEEEE